MSQNTGLDYELAEKVKIAVQDLNHAIRTAHYNDLKVELTLDRKNDPELEQPLPVIRMTVLRPILQHGRAEPKSRV